MGINLIEELKEYEDNSKRTFEDAKNKLLERFDKDTNNLLQSFENELKELASRKNAVKLEAEQKAKEDAIGIIESLKRRTERLDLARPKIKTAVKNIIDNFLAKNV